jgi:hypothetical protein
MMKVARIKCDGTPYMLPEGEHTGANLRAFFGVDAEHELWGERDKDDALIPDDDAEITVEDGARFYTFARAIR